MFRALLYQRKNLLEGAITDLQISKASISEDLTQKASSQISCLSIPTSVEQYDIIQVYDYRGRIVYMGIINGIDDNTLKCSQFQSLFNDNLLIVPTPSALKPTFDEKTISDVVCEILRARLNGYVSDLRNAQGEYTSLIDLDVKNNYQGITVSAYDIGSERYPYFTENNVVNLEQFIYDTFNNYSRIVVPSWVDKESLYWATGTTSSDPYIVDDEDRYIEFERLMINNHRTTLKVLYPEGQIELASGEIKDYSYRYLFDTYENVNNLSIVKKDEDTNTVYIYNNDGTTFRGGYTVDLDGNLVEIENNTQIITRLGTNKTKYIFDSDNDVEKLAREVLPSLQYNHKITFDITFDEKNKFDDYIMGQRIKFYDNANNRLFDTMLTARKYEIQENSDVISKANFTLGKVRTNMTSILNKRKV